MLLKTTELGMLILILLLVCGSTSALAQSQQPDVSTPKVTVEELDTRMELARNLAQEKKFEDALKEYLFIFDNGRGVPAYGGVRLSYVPGEIAEMGQSYPPALAALQSRRDEREKLVLAAKADFNLVHELIALNRYLDEPKRDMALFDKVKTMGPAYSEAKRHLAMLTWQQFVAARRYDDLKDHVDELARRVVWRISESARSNDRPNQGVTSSPQYQSYLRRSIIGEGGQVYETLLALGKAETADKLEKSMFTFATDGEMYAQLINSAINAKRNDVAADLVGRANKSLSRAEDLRLVEEAARRIPKLK